MKQLTAVILAGTIRPSPLRQVLDVPALCLPIGPGGHLLGAWQEQLHERCGASDVRVVVNSHQDMETVSSLIDGKSKQWTQIIAEPTAWRGTGGVLRDVTVDLDPDALVLVAEASCLPPATTQELLGALMTDDVGVMGISADQAPAGVYCFTRAALERVSPVGYHDVKEQLLPLLHGVGWPVRTAQLCDRVHRVRDLRSYLSAIKASLVRAGGPLQRVAGQASVSGSAVMDGLCVVEPGAVVEDGAVLHDSVVLSGATIGGGAVVSRSLVGPRSNVPPRSRVVHEVVVADPSATSPDATVRWPGQVASL